MFRFLLFALFTLSGTVRAESPPDIWSQVIRATNYAATAKASFKVGCKPENPLSLRPQYQLLCPKLDSIPEAVIEEAALPYLKRHLTESTARQALAFWSTSRGASISKKIVQEIRTGALNQLTQSDLQILDKANKSEYGRALGAFAKDREGSGAVARAMLAYEP
jgi:hypothetical protein